MAELRRQGGFTLLELLTVLAILSIAALTVGHLTRAPSNEDQVAKSARTIASALREGKALASLRGEEVDVAIDIDAGEVRIGVSERTTPFAPGIAINARVAREVSVDESVAVVRFLPDGSNTGGGIDIALGDARRRVSVHWLTGGIRVE